MLLVAVLATVTSVMAQANAPQKTLSPEQKEQIKEVREKYSPKIKEIKDELRFKQVEQKTLLASKKVDEKAVYATIDAIGELKASLHKETSALRSEMKDVCPNAGKMMASTRQGNKRPSNGQGVRQGQGNRPGKQTMHQGNERSQRQGMQQGQNSKGQHMAQNSKRPQGNKSGIKTGKKGQGSQHGMRNEGNQGQKRQTPKLDLSDEQKTAIAEVKKEHFWSIQETQNELALLKAKNNTLEERQASFNEMNTLQTKLAKQRMALKLDIMSQLTEEQRMQMISKMQHKGAQSKQGMPQRRQHRA